MTEVSAAPRPRGRPRDADVDHRVMDAARTIYRERGWAGFNFGAIAKAARVSKDSLYRRFDSREDLLVAALTVPPADVQLDGHGDIRGRLIAMAAETLAGFALPDGMIMFRVFVESASNPELRDVYHSQVALPHIKNVRRAVSEAIADGTLPEITNPTVFIDALLGGLVMHVMVTPAHLRDQMMEKSDQFVRDHVDLLLRGAGYRGGDAD
ncbi:TetR/AcrR family transcriptional regulator [Gordonia rhizosphera]|uniref:Putative TetR family transcriptional regulator n=1 Tax=Gordonia rhizosphera NBRC 16068 TaxID=1108045 RepID=K6VZM4_9ACTN|nr:TetR/AcrR family transcriptional regulator [Gordonia rhizosphera]GAB92350.1 putative TetR family transcriptional regulator [Gordonia rhizosphera NBRC 16068]